MSGTTAHSPSARGATISRNLAFRRAPLTNDNNALINVQGSVVTEPGVTINDASITSVNAGTFEATAIRSFWSPPHGADAQALKPAASPGASAKERVRFGPARG